MNFWMITPDLRNNVSITLYQFGYERKVEKSVFGPYSRDFYLIHFVVDGKGFFNDGNKKYDLKKGDIFLIKPGVKTTYGATNNSFTEYYWIGFNGLKAKELVKAMGFIDSNVIHDDKIEDKVDLIKKLNFDHKEMSIKEYCLAYNAMYELFFNYINENARYETKMTSEEAINNAIDYIENHYMEKISVNEIALSASLSRSHLYRLFKESYGVSPSEYLSKYRIAKSVNLVLQTNLSIDEISYLCGFSSVAYFIKVYKKSNGFTPMENRLIGKMLNNERKKENESKK